MTLQRTAFATSVAVLTLLAGCASNPTPQPDTASPTTQSPAEDGKVQAFMLRGNVVIGHENRSIQPCGSSQQYWLQLPSSTQQDINTITRPGYEPMYGEFIGFLEPAPEDGFAAGYDARFTVKQINLLSSEMRQGCQQPPRTTRAFGNEPGWSIEIEDGQATLLRIGQAEAQQNITTQHIQSGQQQYSGKDFSLVMTKNTCSDTMSDSLFGWQAKLNWQGKQYQGCATVGATDVTKGWVGQYQGTSMMGETPTLTTTIELKPDHSAVTRYDYPSGEPSLKESGFWQQVSPTQVKVTMVSLQGRRLISERLFTFDNSALTTQEETINGQTFPLSGNGLELERQPHTQP
ncbi:COG3650 family protein [Photobacterium minamisatsumaniensis]|uniref:COG3650 family protein n=1 Tax=Photobacterium minamisatsumaniensis TaxID=2910233 RepID=UPI003D115567